MNTEVTVLQKVYITKHALTRGIISKMVRLLTDENRDVVVDPETWIYYHGEGREWHRTLESAVKRAKQMRELKITALLKQVEKIKALEFDLPKNNFFYPLD